MTKLYFDEAAHKYTDDIGTKYTSVTTVIGKYSNEFDSLAIAKRCEAAGRNPESPKYEKYKGKTAEQIMEEWKQNSENACVSGTNTHAFIEDSLLESTTHEKYSDHMFTIENITESLGVLDINRFRERVEPKYPVIYKTISLLHSQGFRFFPELAVFNQKLGVSGTIDLFCLKDNKFLIIDWKTNRDPIMFDAGRYEKSKDGQRGKFIPDSKKMLPPLFFMPDSTGNHYTLQVSGYAWLAEQFGYENLKPNLIFQIREEGVDMLKLRDFKRHSKEMFEHFAQI